jgi:hypothetical protein
MTIAPAGAALRATAAAHRPGPAPAPSFGAAVRAQATCATAAQAIAPQPARAALAAVEHARERLDAVLAAARRGRTFSAQELLMLQADAYRYSQTLELASKAVEHAAQTVKQAVNTSV